MKPPRHLKKTGMRMFFLLGLLAAALIQPGPALSTTTDLCSLNLPLETTFTMRVDVNEYDACSVILNNSAYVDTTLSGGPASGYDVTNGTYPGFCVDLARDILDFDYFKATYTVKLYSTLEPPAHLQYIPWDKVNYILNERKSQSWNWLEVQAAIWTLMHGCTLDPANPSLFTCPPLRTYPFPYGASQPFGCPPYGTPPDVNIQVVAGIVTDANEKGAGFRPLQGDAVGVIMDPQSCSGSTLCSPNPDDIQLTIIELNCSCYGTIGDYVWHDLDRDGIQDDGEPGIDGVKVTLKNDMGTIVATTTTGIGPGGSHGFYEFTGLCAGDYKVEVVTPSGFTPTPACSASQETADDSNCTPASVTLTTDSDEKPTIDFGFVSPCIGSIGDYVWHDKNRDGIQDADEPGIQDVTVYLKTAAGVKLASTITDANGFYEFTGLCAGTYVVEVNTGGVLESFKPTTCNVGTNDAIDSDSDAADCTPKQTVVLPNNNGNNDPTIDFGFQSPCSGAIGDFVWFDADRDGIQDTGEPGIDGVRVYLKDASEAVIKTTTTGPKGAYRFDGLCAGTYQVVVETADLPENYVPSVCNTGTNDAVDNDCSPATVVLGNDETVLTVDFGYNAPCSGTIGDFVWYDADRDGIQDYGEPGIGAVTVKLLDGSGKEIASDTTDSNGAYAFNGLCAGTYQVVVDAKTVPTSYVPSTCNAAGADDALDNDCSPVMVTLEGDNDSDITIDFGYISPCTGTIGDYVWNDVDRDGIQDDDEPAIPGVTVILKDLLNSKVIETTTDANGRYLFNGLCAGDYVVEVVKPPGFEATTPCSNDQTVGNDSNCAPAAVSLTSDNSTNHTIDFGFVSPCKGTIGDFVWHDLDRNGIQDSGEPGLASVAVILKKAIDNTVIATTETAANGSYLFTGLCAGDYVVEVVSPAGYFPTSPCSGDQLIPNDSNADDAGTCTPRQTVNLAGDNITIDFGFVTECGIGVDKKCLVVPPVTDAFVCDDAKPIDTLVVLWNGTQEPVSVKAWNGAVGTGTPQLFSGIYKGGEVRFTRSGVYPNDVYFEIFDAAGTKIGTSTFHLSCSDDDMDGPEDCGKVAGDGKAISAYLNSWIFDGMAGNGLTLDCTPSYPEGSDACSFVAPPPPSCATLGVKPKSLVFRYSGGGCVESDNDQALDKVKCTPLPAGSVVDGPITVVYAGGDANLVKDRYVVSPTAVDPDGTFTISWNGADLKADSYIKICDGANVCELNKIHTSCSQPLAVGDIFGSLELAGFNGNYAGAEVAYLYDVSNNGSSGLTVTSVLDDRLGELLAAPKALSAGESTTLEKSALIEETTTNTVTVSTDDPYCKATDTLTVTVQPPPPEPVMCDEIKGAAITSIRLVWDGPDGINIVSEGGQSFSGIKKGDLVILDTLGLGDDVDITITGAVTGKSRFHVSCSDPDMDGSDDCGKYEGDGKDNKADRINLWLFDGMKGGAGEFICGIPSSGVVFSSLTSGSLADVVAAAEPTVGDHWLWWNLTNTGTGTATITKVTVGWPLVSGKLKKVKLDGDTFADPADILPALSPATLTTFVPDVKMRQIPAGATRVFTVEFEKNSWLDTVNDYTIEIEFDNGVKVIAWP